MRRTHALLSIAVAAPLVMLPACQTIDAATAEMTPYGVQLRERIDQWDRWCRGQKLGPYNDGSRDKANSTCNFLFAKDTRWDPNADEFSRYAHSVKLPPPHDKPQVIYLPGMSSKQYFEQLCEKEAGEWIFRTVDAVAGVLQARPKIEVPAGVNQLVPYAFERTPIGSADELQWLSMGQRTNFRYQFFEYPGRSIDGRTRYERYYRSEIELLRTEPGATVSWKANASARVPYVVAERPLAEYAYIGRGVTRPEYELNGIIVTELVVLHRESNEVLAFVRRIGAVRPARGRLGQPSSEVESLSCRKPETFTSSPDFVVRVLKP